MGKIIEYGFNESDIKRLNGVVLFALVTTKISLPITITCKARNIGSVDGGWNGAQSTVTFTTVGQQTVDETTYTLTKETGSGGAEAYVCRLTSTRGAANVFRYDFTLNGISLYRRKFGDENILTVMPLSTPQDVQLKPFNAPVDINPTYDELRKYALTLTKTLNNWIPLSSLPNDFSMIINGTKYTKSKSGEDNNQAHGFFIANADGGLITFSLHNETTNTDVILASIKPGGDNFQFGIAQPDGKIYVSASNNKNDTNKITTTSIAVNKKIKKLIETFDNGRATNWDTFNEITANQWYNTWKDIAGWTSPTGWHDCRKLPDLEIVIEGVRYRVTKAIENGWYNQGSGELIGMYLEKYPYSSTPITNAVMGIKKTASSANGGWTLADKQPDAICYRNDTTPNLVDANTLVSTGGGTYTASKVLTLEIPIITIFPTAGADWAAGWERPFNASSPGISGYDNVLNGAHMANFGGNTFKTKLIASGATGKHYNGTDAKRRIGSVEPGKIIKLKILSSRVEGSTVWTKPNKTSAGGWYETWMYVKNQGGKLWFYFTTNGCLRSDNGGDRMTDYGAGNYGKNELNVWHDFTQMSKLSADGINDGNAIVLYQHLVLSGKRAFIPIIGVSGTTLYLNMVYYGGDNDTHQLNILEGYEKEGTEIW